MISKPALNGCSAQVVAYRKSGRYGVKVSDGVIDVRVVNMILEPDLDWLSEPFQETSSEIIILKAPPTPPTAPVTHIPTAPTPAPTPAPTVSTPTTLLPTPPPPPPPTLPVLPTLSREGCLLKLQGAMSDMNVPAQFREDALGELFGVLEKWSTSTVQNIKEEEDDDGGLENVKPMEKAKHEVEAKLTEKCERDVPRKAMPKDDGRLSDCSMVEKDSDEKEDKHERCYSEECVKSTDSPKEEAESSVFSFRDQFGDNMDQLSVEVKDKLKEKFLGSETMTDPARELSQVIK